MSQGESGFPTTTTLQLLAPGPRAESDGGENGHSLPDTHSSSLIKTRHSVSLAVQASAKHKCKACNSRERENKPGKAILWLAFYMEVKPGDSRHLLTLSMYKCQAVQGRKGSNYAEL